MKPHLLLIIPFLAAAGCASQQTASRGDHPVSREMHREGVDPEYFTVNDNDTEMRSAVRQARNTVDTFIAALQNPSPKQHDFEVKKRFIQNGNVEHIWLSNVTYSGHRFHGYVDNHPRKIQGLKFGQRVSVNPDEITDWAFIDNGKLAGGYTIRVLCTSCNATAKQRMERQGKFSVNNQ